MLFFVRYGMWNRLEGDHTVLCEDTGCCIDPGVLLCDMNFEKQDCDRK